MSDSGFVEKDVEWRTVVARAPAEAKRPRPIRVGGRILWIALIVNAAMFPR